MNGGIFMVNVGKYTIYGCVRGFDTSSWLLLALLHVILCFFACKECHFFFVVEDPNLNTFQIFSRKPSWLKMANLNRNITCPGISYKTEVLHVYIHDTTLSDKIMRKMWDD